MLGRERILAKQATLTRERVTEALFYDPETGIFRWKEGKRAGKVAGYLNTNGHRQIKLDGLYWLAHRLAWFYVHGVWPEDEIDHRNLNKDYNAIDNLREATHLENCNNRGASPKTNKSGYKGGYCTSQTQWSTSAVDGGELTASGKLWSVWDIMFNYGVYGLSFLLKQLSLVEAEIGLRVKTSDVAKTHGYADGLKHFRVGGDKFEEVNQTDIRKVNGLLAYATKQADELRLQAVHDRIDLFKQRLRGYMALHEFLAEVRTLREAFESGIQFKRFYLYPDAKADLVLKFQENWANIIDQFPQARADALAAVDCYALGHDTAAVFHSMRVLEHGLRELAVAVNLTFDVQQWQTIIEQIESEIREIGNRWAKSPLKSDWMSFYSSAAKEFFYFKDGWRNYVSHGGDPYDEHQALSVLEHVRAFMNHLAKRFSP